MNCVWLFRIRILPKSNFVIGLATFVDNNCWYLVGTRLNDDRLTKAVRLFTDNSKNPNWKILSSGKSLEKVYSHNFCTCSKDNISTEVLSYIEL